MDMRYRWGKSGLELGREEIWFSRKERLSIAGMSLSFKWTFLTSICVFFGCRPVSFWVSTGVFFGCRPVLFCVNRLLFFYCRPVSFFTVDRCLFWRRHKPFLLLTSVFFCCLRVYFTKGKQITHQPTNPPAHRQTERKWRMKTLTVSIEHEHFNNVTSATCYK